MKADLRLALERDGAASIELVPRIDFWWRCLDVDEESCTRFASLLSDDERLRAGRFHSPIDRRRYSVRRGALRELLARHLGCEPSDVSITENAFGKPRVEGADVRFSLSHSHGLALYAFARGLEIGCDIEWQDPRFATSKTAELCLSGLELESLRSLPESRRIQAFFHYWTCKEAYLKARGVGLAFPPQAITVSGGGAPCFIALPDDEPAEWSLTHLELPTGYAGALALRGPAPIICSRNGPGLESR
jgi:4'-phosphopantetheinyl transferase